MHTSRRGFLKLLGAAVGVGVVNPSALITPQASVQRYWDMGAAYQIRQRAKLMNFGLRAGFYGDYSNIELGVVLHRECFEQLMGRTHRPDLIISDEAHHLSRGVMEEIRKLRELYGSGQYQIETLPPNVWPTPAALQHYSPAANALFQNQHADRASVTGRTLIKAEHTSRAAESDLTFAVPDPRRFVQKLCERNFNFNSNENPAKHRYEF